jgi:hypothetical protein
MEGHCLFFLLLFKAHNLILTISVLKYGIDIIWYAFPHGHIPRIV